MATYIPNATQTTEPVESRTVESAALEFRTLKTSVLAQVAAVQAEVDVDEANLAAVDLRVVAIENSLLTIGEGGLPGTVYVQRLSGTGAQTVFTLTATPATSNLVDVYVQGIYQNHNTFTVVGDQLTFSEAPLAGIENIEVQVSVTLALGGTDASLVTYAPAGTGAVATNVQSKLRESVSVKDFGAVGDGVTDDTAAIQAAINANKSVTFVGGFTYRVTSQLQLREGSYLNVEPGAKIACYGSRIQAKDVSNVTIECNGDISSVGMVESADDPWDILIYGKSERAFIEFGGTNGVFPLPSGFKVFGTGHIYGDMAGTTAPDPTTWPSTPEIINLKGIGVWECAGDVLISGIKVSRFRGEAVYFHGPQTNDPSTPGIDVIPANVIFENLHVFNVGFNALNFNIGVIEGAFIKNNVVDGFSGQCVEASSGVICGNSLRGSVGPSVQTGGGAVYDTDIFDNDIFAPSGIAKTISAIAASTHPRNWTVKIANNRIYGATDQPIYAAYLGRLIAKGNQIYGAPGYAVYVEPNVDHAEVSGNTLINCTKTIFVDDVTDALVINNSIQDTTTAKTVNLESGPYSNVTLSKYKFNTFNIIGVSGLAFGEIYQITPTPESASVDSRFAKTRAVLNSVNGGQTIGTGSYVISTRRASTATTGDVMDSIEIDSDGHVLPDTDRTQNIGSTAKAFNLTATKTLYMAASGALWTTGFGTPNGVVTGVPGSMYTDGAGGSGVTLYVKESGLGNTGWVAK